MVMSFESGSVSFRMFYGPRELPADFVQRLQAHAAPGLDAVGATPVSGWVTGRHLLDRNITEETIRHAGYLRITLRVAERKVPAELLKAECRMEELAEMAATGNTFVNKRKRAEIKQAVIERLLPAQSPTLKGIPVVHQDGSDIWYAGAASGSQADALCAAMIQLGISLYPIGPESAAGRNGIDVQDFKPFSFTAATDPALLALDAGADFLTWLWYQAETRHGSVMLPEAALLGVLLEGPLLFTSDFAGAHEVALKNGEPIGSAEAKTALMMGKRLVRCRLTFGQGDELWKCTLDARSFVIRGLTLTEEAGAMDAASRFQARIALIDRFRDFLLGVFREYLLRRTSTTEWESGIPMIHEWTANRAGRA